MILLDMGASSQISFIGSGLEQGLFRDIFSIGFYQASTEYWHISLGPLLSVQDYRNDSSWHEAGPYFSLTVIRTCKNLSNPMQANMRLVMMYVRMTAPLGHRTFGILPSKPALPFLNIDLKVKVFRYTKVLGNKALGLFLNSKKRSWVPFLTLIPRNWSLTPFSSRGHRKGDGMSVWVRSIQSVCLHVEARWKGSWSSIQHWPLVFNGRPGEFEV